MTDWGPERKIVKKVRLMSSIDSPNKVSVAEYNQRFS